MNRKGLPGAEEESARLSRVYGSYQSGTAPARWDLSNPGNQRILAEREATIRKSLDAAGWSSLGGLRILDVGCGEGAELASFQSRGATASALVGIDARPEAVARARARHPGIRFECHPAERLPFADSAFDLAIAFTLFSSVLSDGIAAAIASEVDRVLRPGGGLSWYDLRVGNPSNPNVRGITDATIRRLFPGYQVRLRPITLAPPLARRLGPLTPALYPVLAAIPALRTHYAGLLVKHA